MPLLQKAAEVLKNAYAKYSNFPVACAVKGASGEIYVGCNMENSVNGASFCAEQIAIGQAITHGERSIVEVAIINASENAIPPCGVCLQVMTEFVKADLEITTSNGSQQTIKKFKFRDLLPQVYDGTYLK